MTATTDGILGFGTGAAIGGLTGTIEKNIFFQYLEYLKNHPEKIKKLNKKQITKDIKQYYKNYIQQTQDYKPEIGNIHYPAPGIKETITQQFKKALNIQNLKNNIKDSKYLGTEAPNHLRRKNDIKQFHRFQYKNEDYILAELNNGKINYYITKPNKKNPEETLTTISAASSGDGKIPSFININEYLQKNNPAQKINPQISILGTAAINNLINPANIETQSNTQSPVFKIGIEKQVFLPNEKYYSPDHIFTTQDIENMTTEEFTKYEPIIMEQLKHGMISQSPQNYKNYTNPISGENRIYTREDVESMTTNEFSELESQINAQINTIGLPATTDLEYANRFGDDIIYVNSYYRKDGTKVRGYYRSK